MGMMKLDVEGTDPTTLPTVPENALVCQGANNRSYICDAGHCCGETQCCSYYYELWWFWLVWTLIILLTCCCVCQHRRSKQRFQQQRRQNEINLIAYREARNNTQLPLYLKKITLPKRRIIPIYGFLPDYLLPTYEEVADTPAMPPPPYSPPEYPVPPDTALHPLTALRRPGSEEDEEEAARCSRGADPLLGSTATADPLQSQAGPALNGGSGAGGPGPQRDLTPARYRRFTGDSGIEVCDGQDLWDQHGFLGREEQEEEEEEEEEEEDEEEGEVKEEKGEEEEDTKEEIPACDSCSARAVARNPDIDQDRGTCTRALR